MPNDLFACKRYAEPVKLLDLLARKVEFVSITGHLARDPEMRQSASGMTVTTFTLAISWGKRGENQVTEWCSCVAFRETAELIANRYSKGQPLSIIGKLAENKWVNREGVEQVTAQVQVWSAADPLWERKGAAPATATTGRGGAAGAMDASKPINDERDDIPF
jgi:single-strand DNA-binding protein